MNHISRRVLVPIAVLAVLLLVTFAASAVVVRNYISGIFIASGHLAEARDIASRALRLQLDEETGLRGYLATGNPIFLDPYKKAKSRLDSTFAQLHGTLADHQSQRAYQLADDAWAASGTWSRDVATPLLANPKARNSLQLMLRGKQIVDSIRKDINEITIELRQRGGDIGADVSTAVDRLNLVVIGSAATFTLLIVLYGLQLLRISERMQAQDRAVDKETREKAQLYAAFAAEKRIADTLQEAFSHRPLPSLEPLQFSASYVPATEDTKVGGDWYDVVALSEHRVLFAIGDVTGHGIEAAVTMNAARQSLISSALLDPDPAAVLAHANTDVFSNETRLVTAIAGVADASTFEFTYAVAGHPPPILLEPGRAPRMLDCGSLPLGAVAGTTYNVHRVQSVPGAILVLYTDGAVEHSRNVIEGEELLLDAIDAARTNAETDVASFVHKKIFDGRAVGDDVAILTVGFATDASRGLIVSADRAHNAFTSRVEPRGEPSTGSSLLRRKAS